MIYQLPVKQRWLIILIERTLFVLILIKMNYPREEILKNTS
jgi:hypothetical protein